MSLEHASCLVSVVLYQDGGWHRRGRTPIPVQANQNRRKESWQDHTISYKDRISSTWSCERFCLKETGLNRVLVKVSVNVGVVQLISQNAPFKVPAIPVDIPEQRNPQIACSSEVKEEVDTLKPELFLLPILVTWDQDRPRCGRKKTSVKSSEVASSFGRLSRTIYICGIWSLGKCFIILLPGTCNDAICTLKTLPDVKPCPASPAVCLFKSHTNELITCSRNKRWQRSQKRKIKAVVSSCYIQFLPGYIMFIKRTGQFPVTPEF